MIQATLTHTEYVAWLGVRKLGRSGSRPWGCFDFGGGGPRLFFIEIYWGLGSYAGILNKSRSFWDRNLSRKLLRSTPEPIWVHLKVFSCLGKRQGAISEASSFRGPLFWVE